MTRRQFSNTATQATLTASIAASDTSFTLTSFTGYPAPPFIATISRGQSDEEVVLVTALSGSSVTAATRGYDGTTSKSHAAGATFLHTAAAKDYDEANAHVNATTGVHGVVGALVGTTDTQTLSGKTLVSPVLQGATGTGTTSLANVSASGTLSVTGATTLGVLTSANVTVTGTLLVTGTTILSAITGNLATSGTLSGASLAATSGGITGASLTANGLVKGGTVESGASLVLAQIPAQPGAASKQTLWSQVDGGIYTRTGTATNVGRLPIFWGSGTSFPPAPQVGDMFEHTGLNCVMVFTTPGWRQDKIAEVATNAAVTAISANYSAWLNPGFQVVQTDKALLWEWNGSGWTLMRSLGAPLGVGLVLTGSTQGTGLANITGYTVTDSSSGLISVNAGTGVITYNARGRVAFSAEVLTDNGSARWTLVSALIPATSQVAFASINDMRETPAGFPSGGTARQLLTASWSVSPGDTTAVQASSSITSTLQAYVNTSYL